ncbi:MAG: DUF4416 family protein [Candidatus Moduliflexus flocculans]|nr:DUF4416 family protein [Candidatus Moduliflexus flocculans]
MRQDAVTGRPVNIDPGYLTASALIMATAKDFAHRVPLGRGHLRPPRVPVHRGRASRRSIGPIPICGGEPCRAYFRSVRESYLGQLRERPA